MSTAAKHFDHATYPGSALELHQAYYFYWSVSADMFQGAFRALHLDIHQQIEWLCKEGLRRRFFTPFYLPFLFGGQAFINAHLYISTLQPMRFRSLD